VVVVSSSRSSSRAVVWAGALVKQRRGIKRRKATMTAETMDHGGIKTVGGATTKQEDKSGTEGRGNKAAEDDGDAREGVI
jgi:hypothetical protein